MSAQDLLRRLRPGLDSSGSTWSIVRYPADWRAGQASGVTYDHAAGGLTLTPAAPPARLRNWAADQPVIGAGGIAYRVDPTTYLLLAKAPCDTQFLPLPGIGGRGFATGRFAGPAGLAIDALGRIYVCDAGNHRVQVILPETREVLAVLEQGLRQPASAAITPRGEVLIADRETGLIHRFSAAFEPAGTLALRTLDPWTGAEWDNQHAPDPRGIAVLPDGSLTVFDPARAMLWHMSMCGDPLPAIGWPPEALLPAGWQPLEQRHGATGEIVLGPIDGGTPDLAWHKVLIDADIPAGTRLEVQTFAAANPATEVLRWAPFVPVPVREPEVRSREADRLILPDTTAWTLARAGQLDRDEPILHTFTGDGPVGSMVFTLPPAAARKLRSGDRIVFETASGQHHAAEIAAIAPTPVTLVVSGTTSALAGDGPLALVERGGAALPYGPLDMARVGIGRGALGLAALAGDGLPRTAVLPHAFAALLRPGDVLAGAGCVVAVEAPDDEQAGVPVAITLTDALPADCSHAVLRLVETPGRLLCRGDLPDRWTPPGLALAVLDGTRAVSAEVSAIADGAIWLKTPLAGDIDQGSWTSARFPALPATDRGRYLWVRLRLVGRPLAPGNGIDLPLEAEAAPLVRSLRLVAPRPNLLEWLPAVFARSDADDEAPGAGFLERFLALFEGDLARIETAYDSVSRLLDPAGADAEWLDFVGSWLDIAFDPSWPIERRRQLVREAHAIKQGQGTPGALRRYLEIYTGGPVGIVEQFRLRPPPPIQLGARGQLGIAPLGSSASDDGQWARSLAHRFSVTLDLPQGTARAAMASGARRIIETMKPAHTRFVLDLRGGAAPQIGMGLAIGTAAIPGPDPDPCAPDPCAPDSCAPDPASDTNGQVAGGFLLGRRLGRNPNRSGQAPNSITGE